MAEFNSYELSRNWFDWCFENPDKINSNHTALYFFIIEHCNRLGWKERFGLPTTMSMDALGIKNYRTYSKAFDDLVEWGFIKLIEKSKNQWSATVIALVKNTKANTKALSKATLKHSQKQSESIASIDKPINLLTNKPNNTIPEFTEFLNYALEKKPKVSQIDLKLKYDSWIANNWKNGNDKKITNWKTALLNTLPYIKDGLNSTISIQDREEFMRNAGKM
ncbi:MAG: hypothetical protein ACK6D3_08715 [Planctomycetaceae bacterium]|jgi:hypothetical protein